MKLMTISLLFFLATPTFAGTAVPFAKWIPSSWKLIAHETGDLDRDGLDDAVLVVEEANPAKLKPNAQSFGAPVLNLNRRRLVVLLNTPSGFKSILNRDGLIPSQNDETEPCLGDPLETGGVSISRGKLIIKLPAWYSCGSYEVTDESFSFRLEDSRLRFIGHDFSTFSRSSGDQSEYSTNYLTGKEKSSKGLNAFKDSTPKVTWKKIVLKRPFYLDEMSLNCKPSLAPQDRWCQ